MTLQRKEQLMVKTILLPLEKKTLSHHSKQESKNQHHHTRLTHHSSNTPWKGRGRGSYARYGGGRGGRGSGRGTTPFPKYSTIHVNELKSIETLEIHEDITLDSDLEEPVNWKEQMSVMMKHLRESIMVDVKDMMDENMKDFLR